MSVVLSGAAAGGRFCGVRCLVEGGTRGVGVRRSAAATLDARRALLADLPSYGARGPPSRGVPAGRLGRRLAADLELVRTRGIRLFN